MAAYNNLITFTAQNLQYINPQLISSLKQAYSYQAAYLAAIGITRNPDGTLVINQSTLTNALQNNLGVVETAFSGINGLAVAAGRLLAVPGPDELNRTLSKSSSSLVNRRMRTRMSGGVRGRGLAAPSYSIVDQYSFAVVVCLCIFKFYLW